MKAQSEIASDGKEVVEKASILLLSLSLKAQAAKTVYVLAFSVDSRRVGFLVRHTLVIGILATSPVLRVRADQ